MAAMCATTPLVLVMLVAWTSVACQAQSHTEQRYDEKDACISMLSGFPRSDRGSESPQYPSSLDAVSIEYFESGCYGTCPSFTLHLTKDTATWEGHAYVRAKGRKKASITRQQFETFVRAWYGGRFFAMREDYCSATCPNGMIITVTDMAESSITFESPEFQRRVYQCYATIDRKPVTPKPPDEYFEFVRQLRAFAKSQKWLR
jgi:hypothetical protein